MAWTFLFCQARYAHSRLCMLVVQGPSWLGLLSNHQVPFYSSCNVFLLFLSQATSSPPEAQLYSFSDSVQLLIQIFYEPFQICHLPDWNCFHNSAWNHLGLRHLESFAFSRIDDLRRASGMLPALNWLNQSELVHAGRFVFVLLLLVYHHQVFHQVQRKRLDHLSKFKSCLCLVIQSGLNFDFLVQVVASWNWQRTQELEELLTDQLLNYTARILQLDLSYQPLDDPTELQYW